MKTIWILSIDDKHGDDAHKLLASDNKERIELIGLQIEPYLKEGYYTNLRPVTFAGGYELDEIKQETFTQRVEKIAPHVVSPKFIEYIKSGGMWKGSYRIVMVVIIASMLAISIITIGLNLFNGQELMWIPLLKAFVGALIMTHLAFGITYFLYKFKILKD